MLNTEREERYLGRVHSKLTPAQLKRVRHKGDSRKTHMHDREAVPEGQKFRCPRCMPLPSVKMPVKVAGGPRDWTPGGSDAES